MRPQTVTTLASYFLLASLGAIAFILPNDLIMEQAAAASGDVVRVPAMIRDFHRTDPEFTTVPSGGNGHYAGNVALTLGSNSKPTFTGTGFKVASQWKNKAGRPIAPHHYMYYYGGPSAIPVAQPSLPPSHGTFDTYNSGSGAYGGTNVGPAPSFALGAPMPEIVVPLSLKSLGDVGDRTFASGTTLSSNLHCKKLNLSGTFRISGHISILAEDAVTIAAASVVTLNPGATLKLYMKNGGMSWNGVTIGDPLKPSRLTVYNFGTAQFGIHNHGNVYAHFVSPNASLYVYNHGNFYGRFIGKMLEFNNHGGFHIDTTVPQDLCNVALADTAGSKGILSTGGIASASALGKWYSDVLGTNLSANLFLEMTDNGSGVYEYLDDGFYPIDGQLFGNEGESHNNYFTYTFHVQFTHHACGGHFLEFLGSGDCWVYLDGALVIDLGGMLQGTSQVVDLDRLNLIDGRTYRMDFFYAQRNPAISSFRMRTNMDLIVDQSARTISAATD